MRRERGKGERGGGGRKRKFGIALGLFGLLLRVLYVERECLASFCGSCLAVACFVSVLNKKEKGIPRTDWFCSSETHLL